LLSGTCLAAQRSAHRITIVGAEPSGADDAYRSFTSGNIQENTIVRTIADGLRTNLGDKTFPIIRQYVDRIALVKEIEIIEAMKLVWERMKMIIEPSSAVTVAAVMKDRDELSGKRVGIIISGGNVDLGNLPFGAR
jgi:threonine dehydratase